MARTPMLQLKKTRTGILSIFSGYLLGCDATSDARDTTYSNEAMVFRCAVVVLVKRNILIYIHIYIGCLCS